MFDLKLADGCIVRWDGRDGRDAVRRYADAHPGAVVVAWRAVRHGLRFPASRSIVG